MRLEILATNPVKNKEELSPENQLRLKNELADLARRLGVSDLNEARHFPKYFELETYRGCNARCTMCTVYEWENSDQAMSDDLFDKVVSEMRPYSSWIERATLSRDGEPMMDKSLADRVRKLKDAGIKYVTFSTNGSALTERNAHKLLDAGLDNIRFSTDGITKETFEKIRVRLNYDQVMKNFLRFVDLRNTKGAATTIDVRMVLQEANQHEEEQWRKFWTGKIGPQDHVYSKPMHNWGNQLGSYERHNEDGNYSGRPCISPWSTMAIHADGQVGLCGCDYNTVVPMGNLKNQTIVEIWRSQRYEAARRLHEIGDRDSIPICIGCNIWDLDVKKVYESNP